MSRPANKNLYGFDDTLPPVDSKKGQALRKALEKERLVDVMGLIDELSVAELNHPDKNGQTPVIVAASCGHAEVLRKLLRSGASPNEKDPMGANAVLHASCNGHLDCLKILIENKAILDATDRNHETAAYVAAARGYEDILELLIVSGADLNIPDIFGYTPAHIATKFNRPKVLKMMVENGADFELATTGDLVVTCEDLAKELKSKVCLDVLIDARKKKLEDKKREAAAEEEQLKAQEHANRIGQLKVELQTFNQLIREFRNSFRAKAPFTFAGPLSIAYAMLDNHAKELLLHEEDAKKFNALEELFGLPISEFQETVETRKALKTLKYVWDVKALVLGTYKSWNSVLWNDIKTDELEAINMSLNENLREAVNDKPVVKGWKCYRDIEDDVKYMSTLLPLINDLRSNAMRDRHWRAMAKVCQVKTIVPNDPKFTFEDAVKLNLHRYSDNVGEIVETAIKELKIEKMLKDIEVLWRDMTMTYVPHNDTEMFLICPSEEVMKGLEGNQLELQTMIGMGKFVDFFRDRVLHWQNALGGIEDVLKVWVNVSKSWASLEAIFLAMTEIRSQLPDDTKRFEGLDSEFKELMNEAVKEPNVLAVCLFDGRLESLQSMMQRLELCQKSLTEYQQNRKGDGKDSGIATSTARLKEEAELQMANERGILAAAEVCVQELVQDVVAFTYEVCRIEFIDASPALGAAFLRISLQDSKTKSAFFSAVRDALSQCANSAEERAIAADAFDIFSSILDTGVGVNDMLIITESMELILSDVKPAPNDSLLTVLVAIKAWCLELALKEALHVDRRRLRRSRLMIVGEGGAGKTSFFRALTGQQRHEKHLSTVGLDTSDYSVQKKTQLDDRDVVREAGVEVADYQSGSSSWNPLDKELGEADRTLRGEVLRRVGKPSSSRHSSSKGQKRTLKQRLKALETETSTEATYVTQVDEPEPEPEREAKATTLSSAQQPAPPVSPGPSSSSPLRNRIQVAKDNEAGVGKSAAGEVKVRAIELKTDPVPTIDVSEEVANSKGTFNLGFSKSEAEALAFSVWDYGGQRVFQTVQHLFLSRYGVYVLAFDLTKVTANNSTVENSLTYLRYWLRQIGMIALGTPLVLLGTHYDSLTGGKGRLAEIHNLLLREFSSEPAWASLQSNDELCFFPVVNEKTDPNISRLRHLLEEYVEADRVSESDKESYVNSPTPISWLKVCDELKRLERQGDSYIYREAFEEVAQNCGVFSHLAIDDTSDRHLLVSSLLKRLNTLGIVVYLEEDGLSDVVVLNPQWLLDCIVCVVRDFKMHPLKRDDEIIGGLWDSLCKRGVLEETVLDIFWKEEGANISFLTKFLIKIGVMCKLPRSDPSKPQQYLVPAVLSTDSAIKSGNEHLQYADCVKINLNFESFLPEGLLTRLAVALASKVTAYVPCSVVVDEASSDTRWIKEAPSAFSSRGSFYALIPVGSKAQVCLITQGENDSLTASVLGEADESLETETTLINEIIKMLGGVLKEVTGKFYSGISTGISFAQVPREERAARKSKLTKAQALIESEPVHVIENVVANIAEREADEDEQAFRASAEEELSEWLRTCGGVKRAEMRIAMARVLFDAGWDGVQALRDAFLANILQKEETDKYFVRSADRAAFRAALDKETATKAVFKPEIIPEKNMQETPQPLQRVTDVFISYAWGVRHPTGNFYPAQERVKSINAALKRRGLNTWFDSNVDSPHRMQGQMDATMAAAIENTGCVIVIITELYRRKVNGSEERDNCWKEFHHASNQVGPQRMVPVVAEASMFNARDWKGTLGMALGGKLYVNAAGLADGPEWETTMDELCRTVKEMLPNRN